MTDDITALVTHPPIDGKPVWEVQQVKLTRGINADEILVRMVASGICHSDIFCSLPPAGALGITWPRVLGHEGAGIVERVGADAKDIRVGDRVLLSHDECGTCDACKKGNVTRCETFTQVNLGGEPGLFELQDGSKAGGKFFGQSSFASLSVVKRNCVVVVNDLVNEQDLKLLAPLGCGFMTGSGTVIDEVKVDADDTVVITGLGAVGMGALMAAKIFGAKVIAIDRVASRLKMAQDLGADEVLNTREQSDMTAALKSLAKGSRISVVVETTGNMSVIKGTVPAMGKWSTMVLVGPPPMDETLELSIVDLYFQGKTVTKTVMGGGKKDESIRRMISWWKDGVFPIEKLTRFFDARTQAEHAVKSMEDGDTIKPVLVW